MSQSCAILAIDLQGHGKAGMRIWTATGGLAVLMVLATGGLTGCGSSSPIRAVVSVTPSEALYDTPVSATVTGLPPGAAVTLRLTTPAADGPTWSSSAVFTADRSGRVSTAQAPTSGDYFGADPMGLVETLSPGQLGKDLDNKSPWTMTLSVLVRGKPRGSATFTRDVPKVGVTVTAADERPATAGFYGTLYLPAHRAALSQPAVVVFGGSEGGLATAGPAKLLAARGFPALALAYFHEPGLPSDLLRIPLEYFATAARFLARQPGVDPRRLLLWGTSRGSEAALLTASHYPDLIHGVVGSVPGAEAYGSYGNSAANHQAAWTFGGTDIPPAPSSEFDSPDPNSPSAIPVERIRGSMLLVCGGQDQIWQSCQNIAAIQTRLRAHHSPMRPTVLSYPDAGHFVGGLVPYIPTTSTSGQTVSGVDAQAGGTFEADQAARANGWPIFLSFLRAMPAA